MRKKIPKKLEKAPIIDFICELRLLGDNNVPVDLATSRILDSMELSQQKIIKLPILQIPEQIRTTDINLRYQPYYRIEIENIIIQIGPNVVTFSSPIPYIGWNIFKPNIEKHIKHMLDKTKTKNLKRIGLRAINFFDIDIISQTEVSWQDKIGLKSEHYNYNIVYKENGNRVKLNIANQARYNSSAKNEKQGSIIDVDAYCEGNIEAHYETIIEKIDKLHDLEKNIFFNTLMDQFIETLGPKDA